MIFFIAINVNISVEIMIMIIIMIAVISIDPYLTDKGEHTALYKIKYIL